MQLVISGGGGGGGVQLKIRIAHNYYSYYHRLTAGAMDDATELTCLPDKNCRSIQCRIADSHVLHM